MSIKGVFLLIAFTIVKCELPHVKLQQFKDFSIPDLDTICSYFDSVENVSKTCNEELGIVCRNTTLLMTMLDASSKFPYTGLGYSTRLDFGNFDQCMTIDHHYEGGRILGEHCVGGLIIPDLFGNATDVDSAYKLSLCRPYGCSADDYTVIVESIIKDILPQSPLFFLDENCQTVESYSAWTTGDKTVVGIFLTIITLMIISTTYDVCIYQRNRKPLHPLLIAFSVLTNGRKLFHISKHSASKEQIEVFHGIRVISMMWIVAGHGIEMWQYMAVWNVESIITWQKEMYAVYITAGPLAVDTFFYMSGFLLAFQYFKGKARNFIRQVLAVPRLILHRYLRLTPAMVMIYLVVITFFIHLGSGPVWGYTTKYYSDICEKSWWRMFLYVQNYYTDKICLIQTWYLSADMQMFVLSPLVLIPISLQLKKIRFNLLMWEIVVIYILYTSILLAIKFADHDDSKPFNTQTRVLNYFMGIWVGMFMREKIDQPFLHMVNEKRRSLANTVIWFVVILGMLTLIICYRDQELNHGWNSRTVFDVLMRPAWSVGLGWITYSCYHGQGGFINWLLCRPIFQVLSRLTYCIYLTHITVIQYYVGTSRHKWYFNDYTVFYQFCGHYCVSLVVAIFWTLAFESPILVIEKHILGGTTKLREKTQQENANKEEPPA